MSGFGRFFLLPAAGTHVQRITAFYDTHVAAMTGIATRRADANPRATLAVRPGIHAHGAG
jgi:hypothetical protein